ncbi:hypothetical protein [Microbulbifer aggregans]|uniref:hypothetical protein n=1 Tax=Microbulbifer aggregans TaxID=1769779 RepID=UPI001CFEC53A|nr:hypothetical protein [Microbulbifer aggregans]
MKGIVHIGTPKTGSTAAQSWFAQNRARMLESGILYPKSLGAHHHIKLSTACRDSGRPERGFKLFSIASPSGHQKFQADVELQFEEELKKTPLCQRVSSRVNGSMIG